MTATNNVRWSSEKSSDARQFVLRRLSQHHSFSSSSTSSGFRHESHHGCCFIQHIDDIRSHKHQSPFLHFFSDFSIWYSFSSYLRFFIVLHLPLTLLLILLLILLLLLTLLLLLFIHLLILLCMLFWSSSFHSHSPPFDPNFLPLILLLLLLISLLLISLNNPFDPYPHLDPSIWSSFSFFDPASPLWSSYSDFYTFRKPLLPFNHVLCSAQFIRSWVSSCTCFSSFWTFLS